ncbi:IS1106 transposase [Neisseria meningitidis]|nr:IS1106 transposase [Neisseria meningitidis]
MSTFFQQTAQAMIARHIDRFPLLKLDQVIDWQPIEQYLNRQKTRYLRDHRGRPAYPLLSMFKAVLLGQWHSLSDPELEHSLITRIDFNLFCRFDELSIPDYSTLCRYRNRLAQDDTLSELLELINRQLTEKGLKVEKASAAVVDATIIQTVGSKQRYLNRQKTRYLRDHRGRPAYPLLSMFKAVLLGQWHSLSDPELEHSLITRIDFNLFCRFDELSIPDYSIVD